MSTDNTECPAPTPVTAENINRLKKLAAVLEIPQSTVNTTERQEWLARLRDLISDSIDAQGLTDKLLTDLKQGVKVFAEFKELQDGEIKGLKDQNELLIEVRDACRRDDIADKARVAELRQSNDALATFKRYFLDKLHPLRSRGITVKGADAGFWTLTYTFVSNDLPKVTEAALALDQALEDDCPFSTQYTDAHTDEEGEV